MLSKLTCFMLGMIAASSIHLVLAVPPEDAAANLDSWITTSSNMPIGLPLVCLVLAFVAVILVFAMPRKG